MRRSTGVDLKQYVAFAVVAALAINPGVMVAAGPPEAAALASAAPVGLLAVESAPAGADVYLDGHLTGQTPLQVGGLTTGDHRVRVVKNGYLENARVVSVGTSPNTVRVQLTRDVGTRPELAAQLGGGGGGGGGGGSKLPLILAVAGGGAVAAILIAKKSSSSSSSGHAPTVDAITASPATGIVATVTTFTAVNAADQDGDALSFAWDFGDGGTDTAAAPTHTYAAPCTCTVKVTVTAGSDTASTTTALVVKNLNGTWSGNTSCCGPPLQPFTTTIVLTQTSVNLSGTYADSFGNTGTAVGTINATTRQVNLTLTLGGVITFVGTLNAATTTLTGTGNGFGLVNSPWTMTRP